MPEWDELEEVRRRQCRLGSDRWLADLEDAHSFLEDRHLLTLTPDCALPSLFGACEPVGDPEARGFAAWPGDKWWWGNALAERPGCLKTKLHRGKVLFLDTVAASVVDELCRAEEASACAGEHGVEAQRLVAFLQSAGPTLLDEVKANTGLDTAELRRVRARLESRGAVISREVTVDAASGGHRHVSELYLWSQSGTDADTRWRAGRARSARRTGICSRVTLRGAEVVCLGRAQLRHRRTRRRRTPLRTAPRVAHR